MKRNAPLLAVLICGGLLVLEATAQQLPLALDMPVPGVERYNPDIPTPAAVIGHTIGERHTRPDQVVEYFRAVAAVSDRVVLASHGWTYEGRHLIHAFITSPSNHARLEEIRTQNLRLSDDPAAVTDADLAGMPVVAYTGYSIHGNEASGTEAAVLMLYHMAAGEGAAHEQALDDVVLILDPMFNPDGRDRFVDWVNRFRGAVHVADPQDREHSEAWPYGRTNHYYFDLNRDWLAASHPESRGRIELFHRWRPQVLTDHHEMGGNSTFFFQPGIPSRTNPITPARNQELTGEIAVYHAQAFDRIGSLYYAEESFDDFYYGKGSTFPDVNGTIGILFEQGSSRALEREVADGTLHYAYTVRNQFSASLSTLEALVAMRTTLLGYQRDFYRGAEAFARSRPEKAFVISLSEGRTRAQILGQMLQQHRIRLHTLARDLTQDGKTFKAGEAYIVPVDQPQARLIIGAMARMTTFQDSLFYDVSTWALPLTFNVTHAVLQQDPRAYVGAELPAITLDGGALVGGRSDYAYLMPWGNYYAPKALYQMQASGLKPRLMTSAFTAMVDGQAQAFARGTVVIPVVNRDGRMSAERGQHIHELMTRLAEENHVRIFATGSGLTPSGPELGSPQGEFLEQPTIGLLVGEGTSPNNAGEAWHLLTERFQVPISLLNVEDVAQHDLSRYNTLVMTGGWYAGLPTDELKAWLRGGGRLVATSSGAQWALQNELATLEEKAFDMDSLLKDVPYDQLQNTRGAQQVGGSIFEARLDTSHPLAYGYGATVPLFRNSSTFYHPAKDAGTNVGVYTASPLMSGYVSEEKAAQAGESAALVARRFGRGRVILLLDNPNFRAFWYGTNGLFLNAIFFGGAF